MQLVQAARVAYGGRVLPLFNGTNLILAGTVGNLFDRVVFGGVRDFLYFYLIEWPVFNVADCCLVIGAGMLLVQAIFGKKADPAPAVGTNPAAEPPPAA